ncbi:MAG TPA: D-alanyl-D-alanine carboxypeptidase family protein [Candidatus Woesebacteria bacterium]|nr:D-alanyl-D-alanine carboxypeptidase family protein [Candidatus Woesebacteria bacterium]
MIIDLAKLEQLRDSGVNFSPNVFEVIQALQYLKTNGFKNLDRIKSFNDLITILSDIGPIRMEIEEEVESEIRKIIAEGKMIDEITRKYLIEKYEGKLKSQVNKEWFKKLVKRYIKQYQAIKRVDEFKENLIKETVKNFPEINKDKLARFTEIKLSNLPKTEKKPIKTDLIAATITKFEPVKNLLTFKTNLIKKAKQEIITKIETQTGIHLSKNEKKEIFQKLDQPAIGEIKNPQIKPILEAEIKKFQEIKNKIQSEIIQLIQPRLDKLNINQEDKNQYQTVIIPKLINDLPLNPTEVKINQKIESAINHSYQDDLQQIIYEELKQNSPLIFQKEFSEKTYQSLITRTKINQQSDLEQVIQINQLDIFQLLDQQKEELKKQGLTTTAVGSQEVLVFKTLDLKIKTFIKNNPQLINYYRQDRLKQLIQGVIQTETKTITPEQKEIIDNYSEFIAKTYYPTEENDLNISLNEWLIQYDLIKGRMLDLKTALPYSLSLSQQIDQWVTYLKNQPKLQERLKQVQNWNHFWRKLGLPIVNQDVGWILQNRVATHFQRDLTMGINTGIKGVLQATSGVAAPFIVIGNIIANGFKKILNNLGINQGEIKRWLGHNLNHLGHNFLNGALKFTEGLATMPGLALAAVTPKIITVIVVAVVVGLFVYQIYTGSLISGLVPPTAYGGQEQPDVTITPTLTPGISPLPSSKAICYIERILGGKKTLMPVFDKNGGRGLNFIIYDIGYYDTYPGIFNVQKSLNTKKLAKTKYGGGNNYSDYLEPNVAQILDVMLDDLLKEKGTDYKDLILLDAAYRDYDQQALLRANSNWAEAPGQSQHHTGRALDFHFGGYDSSGNPRPLTAHEQVVYNWLVKNAEKYGFYQTYDSEKWHWFYNPKVNSGENCKKLD